MSYAAITPEFYQMNQPESPWHAGGPGWTGAPWPGWQINPAQVGPAFLATQGVGDCGCSSVGSAEEPNQALRWGLILMGAATLGLIWYLPRHA